MKRFGLHNMLIRIQALWLALRSWMRLHGYRRRMGAYRGRLWWSVMFRCSMDPMFAASFSGMLDKVPWKGRPDLFTFRIRFKSLFVSPVAWDNPLRPVPPVEACFPEGLIEDAAFTPAFLLREAFRRTHDGI